jgi:hypothetical protein
VGPVAALVACGDEPEPKTAVDVPSNTAPTPTLSNPPPPPTATATETAAPTPKPAPPTVEDMAASPDPKPLPTVKITGLANEQSLADAAKAKDHAVKLDIKNWDLTKDGQHVHLILDGYPYKKITDAKAPVKLGELLPEGKDLAEGQHFLIAFPSRGTHESVKGKGASSFLTFWVGKKTKDAPYDGKHPLLIYSRPKGDNNGDMAKSLMIDFYLHNTMLDKGEKVHFTITGGTLDAPVTGDFSAWAPKVVKGMQAGEYDVKLELMDKDGKNDPLAWNTTTRHIKVDPDKPNDMAMPMPMGSTSGAPATSSTAPKP